LVTGLRDGSVAALEEELVAALAETIGRNEAAAVDHIDRAGIDVVAETPSGEEIPQILERHPYGQVIKAVAVKVSCGEGKPETVLGLRLVREVTTSPG